MIPKNLVPELKYSIVLILILTFCMTFSRLTTSVELTQIIWYHSYDLFTVLCYIMCSCLTSSLECSLGPRLNSCAPNSILYIVEGLSFWVIVLSFNLSAEMHCYCKMEQKIEFEGRPIMQDFLGIRVFELQYVIY